MFRYGSCISGQNTQLLHESKFDVGVGEINFLSLYTGKEGRHEQHICHNNGFPVNMIRYMYDQRYIIVETFMAGHLCGEHFYRKVFVIGE